MSKEAMQQALEALEVEQIEVQLFRLVPKPHLTNAITVLREALAKQPAQQEFISPGGGYVPAIPTQQPAQQEPVAFLANGTRFKMAFFESDEDGAGNTGTYVTCFNFFEKELDGRWVALVSAEDDCHLKLTPPAQQEPVAWKLVPTEPTEEMLKAMDECSKEGYDERLYAGHAASVYMAAVDAAPTPPAQRKPLTDEELVRADEREACALMCEQMGIDGYGTLAIAAAIRARGNK